MANDLLILRLVNRGSVFGLVEEVQSVWRSLRREGLGTSSRKDLDNRVEHGSSEGFGDGVKVESNAEVAIHGGFVQDTGISFVEDRLVPEGTTGENCSSVVNMSVEDHYQARVVFASPEELARIS